MVNWTEFDKIHVVRRLRQVVGKWWNIQINFTESGGRLRGVPKGELFSPSNRICKMIAQTERGLAGCLGSIRAESLGCASLDGPKLSSCHAGFAMISVPIRFRGEFLGCVVGDGFVLEENLEEQRAQIEGHLKDKKILEKEHGVLSKGLPVLTRKDVHYLTELIEMVVDEILLIQSSLVDAENKARALSEQLTKRYSFGNMVGRTTVMQDLYRLIEKVADSSASLLVQGENGTGKELVAKAVHYQSKRRAENFIAINCGAFNESLLESELFGHVKGAFTGAVQDKEGLFKAADKGTLFLDEIGETSPAMQVKLLRVLQDGSYNQVGSTKAQKSGARIIAATNRNLEEMILTKEFRQDLYFRLNVINLRVPSLASRKDDIPILVDHFLNDFAKHGGIGSKKIAKDCLDILVAYAWPGNVRELQNEIERACILVGDETLIKPEHLSERLTEEDAGHNLVMLDESLNLKQAVENLERRMIESGLERTGWNKSRLAKDLGISRASLIAKVEKYRIMRRSAS